MKEVNKPSPKPFAQFVPAILIAIVVFLDQLSKYWVVNKLNLDRIGSIDLKSFFDLTMVWNYGVSFGIFRANSDMGRWALVGFTGIISIFFFFWLLRAPNRLSQISLSLIIGGAIGNMIDRIRSVSYTHLDVYKRQLYRQPIMPQKAQGQPHFAPLQY